MKKPEVKNFLTFNDQQSKIMYGYVTVTRGFAYTVHLKRSWSRIFWARLPVSLPSKISRCYFQVHVFDGVVLSQVKDNADILYRLHNQQGLRVSGEAPIFDNLILYLYLYL
jgi:hypothetical protein